MEPIQKAAEIERCGYVSQCRSDPKHYADRIPSYHRKPSSKAIAEFAQRQLEEARRKDVAAHEKNVIGLARNQALRDQVTALMKAIGIPERYSVPKPNRRPMYSSKTIMDDAGYVRDLKKYLVVDDCFDTATANYNKLKADYDRFAAEAEKEEAQTKVAAEREAEAKKAQRLADKELVTIIGRYGLPIEAEWPDVLEALRTRDQRLDLAVAMSRTRGDWSEGFYRVRQALERFKIETDEDKNIAACICGCMTNDDGRIFRDTEWSYGRLFEEANDKQLAADIQTAMGQCHND
jgi:hypothetical protein